MRQPLPRQQVRQYLDPLATARLVCYVAEQQRLWDEDLYAAGPHCNLERAWPRFLPWFAHISAVQARYAALDAAASAQLLAAGLRAPKSKAAACLFTLFPCASLRPIYIPITATILRQVSSGCCCGCRACRGCCWRALRACPRQRTQRA